MKFAVDPFISQPSSPPMEAAVVDEGLRRHMLRVYNYMGLGLVITATVAYLVSVTPALHAALFGTPLLWLVILAPLLFVIAFSFSINGISGAVAQALFWSFCAVMGLSLALVFLTFSGPSIVQSFVVAAATFAAMSLYGYTTRADLSKVGSFLVMGLVGVVLASLVNLFVGWDLLHLAISVVGVLVFLGLTAWDTQSIKEQYLLNAGSEAQQKLAVLGALSLYLNFVNLFQLLLSFTGQPRQ